MKVEINCIVLYCCIVLLFLQSFINVDSPHTWQVTSHVYMIAYSPEVLASTRIASGDD